MNKEWIFNNMIFIVISFFIFSWFFVVCAFEYTIISFIFCFCISIVNHLFFRKYQWGITTYLLK